MLLSSEVAAVSEAPTLESVAKSDQQFLMNSHERNQKEVCVCVLRVSGVRCM